MDMIENLEKAEKYEKWRNSEMQKNPDFFATPLKFQKDQFTTSYFGWKYPVKYYCVNGRICLTSSNDQDQKKIESLENTELDVVELRNPLFSQSQKIDVRPFDEEWLDEDVKRLNSFFEGSKYEHK